MIVPFFFSKHVRRGKAEFSIIANQSILAKHDYVCLMLNSLDVSAGGEVSAAPTRWLCCVAAPVRQRSEVWSYFERLASSGLERRLQCRMCSSVIAYSNNSTSNLWIHLRRRHRWMPSVRAPVSAAGAALPMGPPAPADRRMGSGDHPRP